MTERILLIEDDARLAAMVAEYLGDAGLRVTIAPSGEVTDCRIVRCRAPGIKRRLSVSATDSACSVGSATRNGIALCLGSRDGRFARRSISLPELGNPPRTSIYSEA